MRKTKVPWPEDEYYLDKEDKVVYVMGSFMRSMMLAHKESDPVPGYQVKLVHFETVKRLKRDPEYLIKLRKKIKEIEDAKQE